MLDRQQQRSTIVNIPVAQFDQIVSSTAGGSVEGVLNKSNGADVEMSQEEDSSMTSSQSATSNSIQNCVKILHEEVSNVWINVSFKFFCKFTIRDLVDSSSGTETEDSGTIPGQVEPKP